MTTSTRALKPIFINGHRFSPVLYKSTLAVTLSQRATLAMGHAAPEGRDAGEPARKLRERVNTTLLELAREHGAHQVEVYASTRSNTWLVNVEHVL